METQFEEMARRKSDVILQKPMKELQMIKEPCSFLQARSCWVYAARSMACHIYLSSSKRSCKDFVAYLKEKDLHVSELPLTQGYMSLVTLDQKFDSWIQS